MEADLPRQRRRRVPRWRYVVPNAVTCFGLLVGLTSVFQAMERQYLEAAWLIVLCVLLDKLDGTAARLLKATSQIGVQLDSFSDFVTFGVAPGALMYMVLSRDPVDHGLWQGAVSSWVLRALVAGYILAACIRLAKFNVLPPDTDKVFKVFYGVPSTLAGGAVAVVFILGLQHGLVGVLRWTPLFGVALGVLMLSNVPLPKIALQRSRVLNVVMLACVATGFVCGFLRIYPEVLGLLVLTYLVIGLGWTVVHRHDLKPKNLDPYPP